MLFIILVLIPSISVAHNLDSGCNHNVYNYYGGDSNPNNDNPQQNLIEGPVGKPGKMGAPGVPGAVGPQGQKVSLNYFQMFNKVQMLSFLKSILDYFAF